MKEKPVQVVRIKGLPTLVLATNKAERRSLPSIIEQELRCGYCFSLEIDETRVYNPETGEIERV